MNSAKSAKPLLFSQLQKAIKQGDIESCCHWVAYIDIMNLQEHLWEKLILYCSKYIHIHNPKLPLLLHKKIQQFKDVEKTMNAHDEIWKNHSIRRNWCQLMFVIVGSKKGIVYTLPNSNTFNVAVLDTIDLHPIVLRKRRSDDSSFIQKMISMILTTPLFSEKLTYLHIMYKLESSSQFPYHCSSRPFSSVESKYHHDWIWLLWECILEKAILENVNAYEIIISLQYLFCYRYQSSKKYGRYPLVVHALLLCEDNKNVLFHQNVFSMCDQSLILKACNNIDSIYDEILMSSTLTQPPSTTSLPPPTTPTTQISSSSSSSSSGSPHPITFEYLDSLFLSNQKNI
jgi:hypothetical protein